MLQTEVDDLMILLDTFTVTKFYGSTLEIALPTFYERGISKCKILIDNESYAPVPYTVARYRLVWDDGKFYTYVFEGVEIKNND